MAFVANEARNLIMFMASVFFFGDAYFGKNTASIIVTQHEAFNLANIF